MIRLYFCGGIFDGGSADFDPPPLKSKKANAKGEAVLPVRAFVAGVTPGGVWRYELWRIVTPYSAIYKLWRWADVAELTPDYPIVYVERGG